MKNWGKVTRSRNFFGYLLSLAARWLRTEKSEVTVLARVLDSCIRPADGRCAGTLYARVHERTDTWQAPKHVLPPWQRRVQEYIESVVEGHYHIDTERWWERSRAHGHAVRCYYYRYRRVYLPRSPSQLPARQLAPSIQSPSSRAGLVCARDTPTEKVRFPRRWLDRSCRGGAYREL